MCRIEREIKGKDGSQRRGKSRRKLRMFSRVFIVQVVLQSGHTGRNRVLLSSDQPATVQNLIQQAKTKLDNLRAGK